MSDEVKTADALKPARIVAELDQYIVGQADAKRAVAIALRNRWRRQRLAADLRDEVAPKNIIMIGPTGVGKTEIARRLARLAQAPFIKVEATRYTEVGYVGRDVESMIRDLTDLAVGMVRSERLQAVSSRAEELAEGRLLDLLLPLSDHAGADAVGEEAEDRQGQLRRTREKLLEKLRRGELDGRSVEVEQRQGVSPMIEVFSGSGVERMGLDLSELFGKLMPGGTKRRKMSVAEARRALAQEEAAKLIDMDEVVRTAIARVENSGIVFLDEIDKIAGPARGGGPDVSREGVQRDILPIVEGTTVATRYGMVRTDHILFIAAGAFHVNKPSDLIPELQGRFPIRVELHSLSVDDFVRILTEPRNSLIRQYTALLETEGVHLDFTPRAVRLVAEMAFRVNEQTEDIGARRLHTVMEKLLEEISFDAPDVEKRITIDEDYVRTRLAKIVEDRDITRYIL